MALTAGDKVQAENGDSYEVVSVEAEQAETVDGAQVTTQTIVVKTAAE